MWCFRDLHSTNGTLVGNNHTILEDHQFCFLSEETILTIGETLVKFKYLPEPAKVDLRKKTSNVDYIETSMENLKKMSREQLEAMFSKTEDWLCVLEDELSARREDSDEDLS